MLAGSRRLTLVVAVVLATGGLVAQASDRRPITRTPPMLEMGARYGHAFSLPEPPAGQTPEQRAAWITEQREVLGRAPLDWARWAQTTFDLDAAPRATTPPATRDLATEVARVYGLLGLTPDLAELTAAAAALPVAIRAPFADLVAQVADVAAAQAPVAAAVEARLRAGWDPLASLLTIAERDLMTARQARIMESIRVFRARTQATFEHLAAPATHGARSGGDDPPLFSDPEGLIVLGGVGNATYTRAGLFPDPVLLVDPAGNDRYENSAGGACPLTIPDFGIGSWMECNNLTVSVVADLGDGVSAPSDDVYFYNGPPSAVQGAGGHGGLGLLVDVGGNDVYDATMTRGAQSPFQPLVYYFDGGAQGFGYAGSGALIDGVGDDVWRFAVRSTAGRSIWGLAQGFGAGGGIGIASDGAGADQWLTYGLGLVGGGFEGIYANGTGFYGGVGIMTDTGLGDDVYYSTVTATTVDYYSFGFGAFGGLGVLYEDGGNDDYYTFQEGTNPWIDPLLNCAYGTASFGGVGVMVDLGGNDVYYGESVSPYGASVMDNGFGGPGNAYGVFVDIGGDDRYEMVAQGSYEMIIGRGLYEPSFDDFDPFGNPGGHNTWGTFVDIGGNDTYIPDGYGANNSQWPFGIDRGV